MKKNGIPAFPVLKGVTEGKLPVALLLVFWLTIVFSPASLAPLENKSVRFQRFSVENGLPQPSVTSIIQDSDGFLWFGTFEGLCRFDGYSFKVYTHNDKNPSSIGGDHISTLFLDRKNQLWVGFQVGGLSKYDRMTDAFVTYRRNPGDKRSISSNSIYHIIQDAEGVLWIATGYGLNRFDPEQGYFESCFPTPESPDMKDVLPRLMVCLVEDAGGVLWIGTQGGLLKFHKTSRRFEFVQLPKAPLNMGNPSEINAMFMDRDRILWLGTGAGIVQLDCKTGLFPPQPVNIHFPSGALFSESVLAFQKDSNGHLWMGAMQGLFKIDQSREKYEWRQTDLENTNSISSNVVSAIFEDKNGNIWLGTNGGITRMSIRHRKFRHFLPDGKTDCTVYALHEDKQGRVWFGSAGLGLYRCNLDTGESVQYLNDPNNPASLSNNCILSLFRDSNEELWIGTGNGLCRMVKDGVFQVIPAEPNIPGRLSEAVIPVLYEDAHKALWVGSNNGLFRMDRKTGFFECFKADPKKPGSINHNNITSVFETRQRELWITTFGGGLVRFDRLAGTFVPCHLKKNKDVQAAEGRQNLILSSLARDTGDFWLGTFDSGLFQCDQNGNSIKNYTVRDGMASNCVIAILEDEAGLIWISSNKGISRFDPRRETFRCYDTRDGLQGYEFKWCAASRGSSGRLYFGGVSGFNAFFPATVQDNDHVPPIFITGVRLTGEPLERTRDGKNGDLVPVERAQRLEVPFQHNMITLEFAALDYLMPERNRYKYTLEGFTPGWLDLGNRRDVTFTNLDPGKYVFRVKGSNNDGVWNEEGRSLTIVILPPFWRTIWFRGAVVILMGVMIILLYRRRMRLMVQRLEGRMRLNYLFERYGLSAREQEILELLLTGKSGKDIEQQLYISIKTVRTHIYNIYKKVGVRNRVELMSRFQHATAGNPVVLEEI